MGLNNRYYHILCVLYENQFFFASIPAIYCEYQFNGKLNTMPQSDIHQHKQKKKAKANAKKKKKKTKEESRASPSDK